MRYPKLRELGEAIRALIKGPYTNRFPYKPHEPFKNFRGKPEYFEKFCVGCKACAEVCPAGCIEVKDILDTTPPVRRLELHYDSCIFCGQCQASCITGEGIKLSNKFDIALFDRREAIEAVQKELLLCEGCGCLIGARDHLLWIYERLGELAFSNPTTYISALKNLSLAYEEISPATQLTRQDRLKILCHRCRREITLGG